jgi:hypothetical protein
MTYFDMSYEIYKYKLLYHSHGNKVACIVAAEKDNNICSGGIAYDATIVGKFLKI